MPRAQAKLPSSSRLQCPARVAARRGHHMPYHLLSLPSTESGSLYITAFTACRPNSIGVRALDWLGRDCGARAGAGRGGESCSWTRHGCSCVGFVLVLGGSVGGVVVVAAGSEALRRRRKLLGWLVQARSVVYCAVGVADDRRWGVLTTAVLELEIEGCSCTPKLCGHICVSLVAARTRGFVRPWNLFLSFSCHLALTLCSGVGGTEGLRFLLLCARGCAFGRCFWCGGKKRATRERRVLLWNADF